MDTIRILTVIGMIVAIIGEIWHLRIRFARIEVRFTRSSEIITSDADS